MVLVFTDNFERQLAVVLQGLRPETGRLLQFRVREEGRVQRVEAILREYSDLLLQITPAGDPHVFQQISSLLFYLTSTHRDNADDRTAWGGTVVGGEIVGLLF